MRIFSLLYFESVWRKYPEKILHLILVSEAELSALGVVTMTVRAFGHGAPFRNKKWNIFPRGPPYVFAQSFENF